MIKSLILSLCIVKRNWMVYRKDFVANISPSLAEPIFMLTTLGLGLGVYLQDIQGLSYKEFLAPGLPMSAVLFTSFFESSYGFYVRMTFENVFKAMLTTHIGYKEIIWGEFLWVGLKGSVMALAVSTSLVFLGLMPHFYYIPWMFLLGFLVALPCGAIGLLACAYVRNMNQFQSVYSFLIAPIYFLSGIFFPLKVMPQALSILLQFFPFIHGVKIAQALFWDQDILQVLLYHGSILILQTTLLFIWTFKAMKKKLIS